MTFICVKTLITLKLLSEHTRGRPTWSVRADLVPAGTMLVTPGLWGGFQLFCTATHYSSSL